MLSAICVGPPHGLLPRSFLRRKALTRSFESRSNVRLNGAARACYQSTGEHPATVQASSNLNQSAKEVEAAVFLASSAADESRLRAQRLPISQGRLPTFLAPTVLVSKEPSEKPSSSGPIQAQASTGSLASDEEPLAELIQIEIGATLLGDVAGPQANGSSHSSWQGETAGSYKARADVMLRIGDVMAQRFRETAGSARS